MTENGIYKDNAIREIARKARRSVRICGVPLSGLQGYADELMGFVGMEVAEEVVRSFIAGYLNGEEDSPLGGDGRSRPVKVSLRFSTLKLVVLDCRPEEDLCNTEVVTRMIKEAVREGAKA